MKYLLQQPQNLEDLTTATLASWIALQAKKFLTPIWELRRQDNATEADAELTRQIENLKNHFSRRIPKKFQDTLASNIIKELTGLSQIVKGQNESNKHVKRDKTSENQVKIIGRIVETSFTEQLSILSIDMDNFTYNMFRDPLSTKSHMISGLVTLELKFKQLPKNNVEFELIQLLKNLHSLKYLTIHHACTDEILKCIAFNCILIEDLDISYSGAVGGDGIKILNRLANLKSIHLRKTSISQIEVETLLLDNKKLEEIDITGIDNYHCRMPQILKEIAITPNKFPKFFKITNYKSDNDTVEELELVAQMCPLITNLFVRKSRSLVSFASGRIDLSRVAGLTNLRKLTLVGYAFYADKIKEVLEAKGHNLVDLNLVRIKQVNIKALVAISEICPNLQRLSLRGCSITTTEPTSNTQELKIQPLVNLKTLIILGTFYASGHSNTNLQYESTHEAVFLLLSKCLNVEFVGLSKSWLTDDLMMKVLNYNPMVHLRELKIREHQYDKGKNTITALVVDQFIQNCNNRPEIVLEGDVDYETNVEESFWTPYEIAPPMLPRHGIQYNNLPVGDIRSLYERHMSSGGPPTDNERMPRWT